MTGWECPRCGCCYAPHVTQCPGCEPRTFATTGDDPTGYGFQPCQMLCKVCDKTFWTSKDANICYDCRSAAKSQRPVERNARTSEILEDHNGSNPTNH
jgi:hypothetical protein